MPEASESEKVFLDRLMLAESGGRLFARNPATGAFGPYQFLASTFLDVVQRNFPEIIAGKSNAEILDLRANAIVSRNAALIYTRENGRFLAEHGAAVTAGTLRLAFFVGPGGALKVLSAKPEEPVSNILSAAAIEANPFMARMTAAGLIGWASRQAEGVGLITVAAATSAKPKIAVRCNLKLASCRKWLVLAGKRMSMRETRLAIQSARR
jgi:hypothetical protein